MADLPPIIQYWHSEDVPDDIAGLLESFADMNPDRPHLVFSEPSAATFIGRHFDSRRLRAFSACAVPAMQSDYLRYCAALVLGGVYFDADSRCVESVRSMIPSAGCGQLYQSEGGAIVNGIFAFGSPGHAFLELALEVATVNIEQQLSDLVYATTGPLIFTNLHRAYRLGSFEALIENLEGRHYAEPAARVLRDAIGDYTRVTRAFEGITISPISENIWMRAPGITLHYKDTDVHWVNHKGTIFRE